MCHGRDVGASVEDEGIHFGEIGHRQLEPIVASHVEKKSTFFLIVTIWSRMYQKSLDFRIRLW
jgi:hypothetical protein